MKNRTYYVGIFLILLVGIFLRFQFSPDINFETDSFSVLLSARNILEKGQYLIPPIALTDHIHYQQYTGWGAGYPLLLSILFFIFGYGETVARCATILICSVTIPVVAMLGNRVGGKKVGIVSGLLVAVNPLLICINGRILTANMGFSFFVISITLLIMGSSRRTNDMEFLSTGELLNSRRQLVLFCLSFLFFGITLSTRDDYAMFALVFLVVSWSILKKSPKEIENKNLVNYLKLGGVAALLTIIGYLPNIYFNYKNYGRIFTSSHYEYGGRLSLEYFLRGSHGAFSLPGWAVMVITILIYAIPIVSIFLFRLKMKGSVLLFSIIIAIVLPIIFINGAYPVTSSGASPRYVIPLIPFTLILASIVLVAKPATLRLFRIVFMCCLAIWHVILFYPPLFLFETFPKIAYLTQYSPWYNTHNYMNYPHPVLATLEWVKSNTPPNAIILSDYDNYHYFFYTKRDVMNRDNVEEIKKYIDSRPMFFIEDHQKSINPNSWNDWRRKLLKNSIICREKYSMALFSPSKGEARLRIYELFGASK